MNFTNWCVRSRYFGHTMIVINLVWYLAMFAIGWGLGKLFGAGSGQPMDAFAIVGLIASICLFSVVSAAGVFAINKFALKVYSVRNKLQYEQAN